MGRKAGVSAAETRATLLDAAARVFAAKGYDGASINDITSEADLSSGAIYSNYGGKAELFVAAVREHAHREFTDLVGLGVTDLDRLPQEGGDLTEVLAVLGVSYGQRMRTTTPLMMEAMVAARRHPEVGRLVRSWLLEGEDAIAAALVQAQDRDIFVSDVSAPAASRFLTVIALGTRLASAMRLPDVESDEWEAMIDRLIDAFRREGHPD